MATHTITLNATEESIYQKYLEKAGTDDAAIMTQLKGVLTDRVVSHINQLGADKFKGMTVAEKIAWL